MPALYHRSYYAYEQGRDNLVKKKSVNIIFWHHMEGSIGFLNVLISTYFCVVWL